MGGAVVVQNERYRNDRLDFQGLKKLISEMDDQTK